MHTSMDDDVETDLLVPGSSVDGTPVPLSIGHSSRENSSRAFDTIFSDLSVESPIHFESDTLSHVDPEFSNPDHDNVSSNGAESTVDTMSPRDKRGPWTKPGWDEDNYCTTWAKRRKHFFIFSAAGKPIFSRYGSESKLSGFMAVMVALISFVQDQGDTLRSLHAGDHIFVFEQRGPLALVAVSSTGETVDALRAQIHMLHSSVISTLTRSMEKVFDHKANFDLRDLLGGTEQQLINLFHRMDATPDYFLDAIQCLAVPKSTRQRVGDAIYKCAGGDHMLFGLLISAQTIHSNTGLVDSSSNQLQLSTSEVSVPDEAAGDAAIDQKISGLSSSSQAFASEGPSTAYLDRLVQVVSTKRVSLHPQDLFLLMNFVSSSQSIQSSVTWTPICLPNVSAQGFVYAYIEFIRPSLCLFLISRYNDPSYFEMMMESKTKIAETLESDGTLDEIERAVSTSDFSVADLDIPGLQHFLYLSEGTRQYACPRYDPPFSNRQEARRLLRQYSSLYSTHFFDATDKSIFRRTESECILISRRRDKFTLFATFSPHIDRSFAVEGCNSIKNWLKNEEKRLFLLSPPSWS